MQLRRDGPADLKGTRCRGAQTSVPPARAADTIVSAASSSATLQMSLRDLADRSIASDAGFVRWSPAGYECGGASES